ncbi:MAG: hypothetical protein DMF19_02035 [Verrucomicrobia bacterium]|nr:MAG: hypothetical protein DMF19_02035 [Verrucomicrobiota bacterium]
MRFFPSFANWRPGILQALTRFPWNILCGVTGAGCAIVSLHFSKSEALVGQCVRLAMTVALGMPLFFSLRMLRERQEQLRRWPIEIISLPLLAWWFFALPPRPFDGPGIIWIRWLLLLAALHFFVAVSAYLWLAENSGFWQFNRKLFLRFCLATLYTGVLVAGLELALLSADKLFQLKIEKAYGDLFFLMVGVFHPAFFLAGVPADFPALNSDTEYPRGLKAFTQFALAPLVAVYTAILYAYAIKIVLARSWPHGWVALPVLLLSGIGIFAFLLLSPLRTRPEENWGIWFTRNFPRALAPLSILLLLSVHLRVREYGVTEQRYLGIVAAVWTLTWAFVFILRRNAGIRWVPFSLALICLFAAFGPWSAGAVSRASQLGRVRRVLQQHGLWADNHAKVADRAIDLPEKESTDLQSTLSYLIETHGGTTIKNMFEQAVPNRDWAKLTRWSSASEIIDALKIHKAGTGFHSVYRKSNAAVNIEGFRHLCRIENYGRSDWQSSTFRCDGVGIGLEDGILKIVVDDDKIPQPIPLDNLFNGFLDSDSEVPDEKLTVDYQHSERVFRLIFNTLLFSKKPEGSRITSCSFYLLEK